MLIIGNIITSLSNVSKLLCTQSFVNVATKYKLRVATSIQPFVLFHKTSVDNGLMEFFDDTKNWGQSEVKVGRSWKTDELRIKSNEDLHKLWFVLLKERNMLKTMEHECKEQTQLFPNPERIDKVDESMKNLELVVRERNEAYFMLETGKSGEQSCYMRKGALGLKYLHRTCEYLLPKFMNRKWQKNYATYSHTSDVKKFLKLYREKLFVDRRKAERRDLNHVLGLLKRFPNLDEEAVKEEYPSVDIQKIRYHKKTRGHHKNIC